MFKRIQLGTKKANHVSKKAMNSQVACKKVNNVRRRATEIVLLRWPLHPNRKEAGDQWWTPKLVK